MRKLLISLSALVLVAFSVRAQTPAPQRGLKAGYIALVVTGEVLPGQMENFRQLVPKLVAAVAEESGTLVYEWSFHPDQKTYNVMEVYQNSDAIVAHLKHLTSTDFLKELGQVRKTTNAIVFGSPDAQVKEALTRLDPVYTSHIDGFMR
jgi:quinol monooxygenase YgiN